MSEGTRVHRSDLRRNGRVVTVHIFAFCSPILLQCGTCPRHGSVTSPFGARDAARPSPPRSEPCQILGLFPTVRSAGRSAGTCQQRFFGEHCHRSLLASSIAWWCADG